MDQHSEAVQKEIERIAAIPWKNKGSYDYREVEEGDCELIRPCFAAIETNSKQEHPRIFAEQCCLLKNVPGSKKGRMWKAIKGNMSACIAFPLEYFESPMSLEFFPVLGAIGIKRAFNKFAPDQYDSKYPNDIVCKKHWRKTCGMLYKKNLKYAFTTFGVDLVDCPNDDELREHGLKACCIKKHTDKVPTFEEFLCAAVEYIIEILKEANTPEKIVEIVNSNFQAYKRKSFFIEINNAKADCSKDGAMYCPEFPNAMMKGYVNGQLYCVDENLYDSMIPPDDNDEVMKKYDIMYNNQLHEDHLIQAELEKAEAEKKEEGKK